MARSVFLGNAWIYPTVPRTEHGPSITLNMHSPLIYSGPGEFVKYFFSNKSSQGTWLPLLSQGPLQRSPLPQASEPSWLIPIYTSAWTNSHTQHPCPRTIWTSKRMTIPYSTLSKWVYTYTLEWGARKQESRSTEQYQVEKQKRRHSQSAFRQASQGSQGWHAVRGRKLRLKFHPPPMLATFPLLWQAMTKATYCGSPFQRS